jgi:hypothetical protein
MPKFSIGKPLYYEFFAPLNDKNDQTAKEEITYDFKSMPDEVTLLEAGNKIDYAKRQCLKICYYLQKVR